MAPRVVSVPMDLGASGDPLWVPEAGNTAQEQPPHRAVAGSPGMCVEVPAPLTAPPLRHSEQDRSEDHF